MYFECKYYKQIDENFGTCWKFNNKNDLFKGIVASDYSCQFFKMKLSIKRQLKNEG
jgi:hypothetical protein